MDITLINSILKGQYSIVNKVTYKIMIRNKEYNIDEVIRDLMKTIEQLENHINKIAELYDLEIDVSIK